MAEGMRVQFLGSIPLDPKIAEACDAGQAFVDHYAATPTAQVMQNIIQPIAALDETKVDKKATQKTRQEDNCMRIAIPLADGKLAMHFGHCERFALIDVDQAQKKILTREDVAAPPHEPGLLPRWLAERGANTIISGGMGQRARGLFEERGILVLVGAPPDMPENLVGHYLAGTIQVGQNICDH